MHGTTLGTVAGIGSVAEFEPRGFRSGDGASDVVVWEASGSIDGSVGYGHHIAARLAASGLAVSVIPLAARLPDTVELEASVHVLSGGTTPVTARVGWLDAARRLLDGVLGRALVGQATVTGICFGAQLIADMLAGPGTVVCHPDGMQAGIVDAVDTVDGRIVPVASFHYHHIRHAPIDAAGGRVVLASATTPVQAFEFGDGVRGVQSHPELGPDELTAALVANRDVLERHGANVPEAVASIEAARVWWTDEVWERFVIEPAHRFVPAERTDAEVA